MKLKAANFHWNESAGFPLKLKSETFSTEVKELSGYFENSQRVEERAQKSGKFYMYSSHLDKFSWYKTTQRRFLAIHVLCMLGKQCNNATMQNLLLLNWLNIKIGLSCPRITRKS